MATLRPKKHGDIRRDPARRYAGIYDDNFGDSIYLQYLVDEDGNSPCSTNTRHWSKNSEVELINSDEKPKSLAAKVEHQRQSHRASLVSLGSQRFRDSLNSLNDRLEFITGMSNQSDSQVENSDSSLSLDFSLRSTASGGSDVIPTTVQQFDSCSTISIPSSREGSMKATIAPLRENHSCNAPEDEEEYESLRSNIYGVCGTKENVKVLPLHCPAPGDHHSILVQGPGVGKVKAELEELTRMFYSKYKITVSDCILVSTLER